MKMIYRACFLCAIAMGASQGYTLENQKDDKYFYDSCVLFLEDSTNEGAQACSDYIHGFLEGARIVESLFIAHLESQNTRLDGFSERAFRTRVGRPDDADLERPSAPFCLPDSEFNADIIEKLMDRLPNSVASLQEMDQRLFEALKAEYTCT